MDTTPKTNQTANAEKLENRKRKVEELNEEQNVLVREHIQTFLERVRELAMGTTDTEMFEDIDDDVKLYLKWAETLKYAFDATVCYGEKRVKLMKAMMKKVDPIIDKNDEEHDMFDILTEFCHALREKLEDDDDSDEWLEALTIRLTVDPAKAVKPEPKPAKRARKTKKATAKGPEKAPKVAPKSPGTMKPWDRSRHSTQTELYREAMGLNKSASLDLYVIWVAHHLNLGWNSDPVGPCSIFIDPDHHTDEITTWEGDYVWPHLVLWATLGLLNHYAFPKRGGGTDEEEQKTIYGMLNYEVHYDGYDGMFLKVTPNELKNKDGSPFNWKKVNRDYLRHLENYVEMRHKKKDY